MKKASPRQEASPKKSKSRNNTKPMSPRLQRLCRALLRRPHSVWELRDKIPCSYPPPYVRTLRIKHGMTLPCVYKKFVTVDGKPSRYGRYVPTDRDKAKLKKLLGR